MATPTGLEPAFSHMGRLPTLANAKWFILLGAAPTVKPGHKHLYPYAKKKRKLASEADINHLRYRLRFTRSLPGG